MLGWIKTRKGTDRRQHHSVHPAAHRARKNSASRRGLRPRARISTTSSATEESSAAVRSGFFSPSSQSVCWAGDVSPDARGTASETQLSARCARDRSSPARRDHVRDRPDADGPRTIVEPCAARSRFQRTRLGMNPMSRAPFRRSPRTARRARHPTRTPPEPSEPLRPPLRRRGGSGWPAAFRPRGSDSPSTRRPRSSP